MGKSVMISRLKEIFENRKIAKLPIVGVIASFIYEIIIFVIIIEFEVWFVKNEYLFLSLLIVLDIAFLIVCVNYNIFWWWRYSLRKKKKNNKTP